MKCDDELNRDEEERLLYVLGELPEDRRREMEAALGDGPAAAEELREMTEAFAAVSVAPVEEPAAVMALRLRRAIHADLDGRRHWLRRAIAMSALAATILVVITLISVYGPSKAAANLLWQDVSNAMSGLNSIHSIEYWVNRDHNLGSRVSRVDCWYFRSGLWRAHGFGYVHFLSLAGQKLYDVNQRRFLDPASVAMKPINVDQAKTFKEGPLLDSIMQALFGDDRPTPAPVAVAGDHVDEDIQVFECSGRPGQVVRFWVLRSSRLPIRMQLIEPANQSEIDIELDYADPQPASFFDPDAFAAAVDRLVDPQPPDIFQLGRSGAATTQSR